MYNTDMLLPCRQFLLLSVSFLFVRSSILPTKSTIILKAPGKTLTPTETPHKSVHVKYTLADDEEPWTIVGFEPKIQQHHKAVEELTVHLCDSPIYHSIWYDDKTICSDGRSILIYAWASNSSLSPFHLPADSGFEIKKSRSIILTVIYKKEKRTHKEQSGILLHISTQPSRFQMGAMFVGNKQKGTHFSCRLPSFTRLLYGVKKLNFDKNDIWWSINTIRSRLFRSKLVQLVLDSKTISNVNQSDIEIVSSNFFLLDGDYLLIECENISQSNCYFLIYYTSKSKFTENDHFCQNNDFPDLFKHIPSKETTTSSSSIDGSTIFFSICIFLLIVWISTIIGCIIMRRIRGLVNYRTESTFSLSGQKNKFSAGARSPNDHFNGRTGDADHIMQIDGEHAGIVS